MTAPDIKFDVKITGNPLVDGVLLKVVGYAAAAIAVHATLWLKSHGFDVSSMDPATLTEFIGGGLISAIVVVLGWVKNKNDMAKAAQGGVNLVLSGKALTTAGTEIKEIGLVGAPPPLPVTPATALPIAKLAAVPKA